MSRASDLAYARIRQMILTGVLAPGAQVKEEDLADHCGVSRTPVRDAMHRLEAEMFIQRSDSQRSFVSKWSAADIDELFTLRTMLEGYAAARAAERVTPGILGAMQANSTIIAKAIDRASPDVDTFLAMNAEFHGLVIQAAASHQLAKMLNRLVLQPIVHHTAMRYDGEQLARSLAEHIELTTALAQRDAEWASAVMTAHIRRALHVYRSEQKRPVG